MKVSYGCFEHPTNLDNQTAEDAEHRIDQATFGWKAGDRGTVGPTDEFLNAFVDGLRELADRIEEYMLDRP